MMATLPCRETSNSCCSRTAVAPLELHEGNKVRQDGVDVPVSRAREAMVAGVLPVRLTEEGVHQLPRPHGWQNKPWCPAVDFAASGRFNSPGN